MPKRKYHKLLRKYNNKRQEQAKKRQREDIEEEEEFSGDVMGEEEFSGGVTDEDNETDKEKSEKGIDEETTIPIKWEKNKERNTRIIKGLPKSTYYHKFGASGTLANSAKGTHKISNFFKTASTLVPSLWF